MSLGEKQEITDYRSFGLGKIQMKLAKCLPFRDLIFLWKERSVYKYVVKYVAKITLPQLFLFLNLAPGVESLF